MSIILLLVAGAVVASLIWAWSMRSVADATRVALVTVLGVTASAFNVIVPIASVEATTTVVLCTSIVLGARLGIAVAIVAILGSSVAGGVGPWTIWQLLGWSVAALVGAGVGRGWRRIDWFEPAGALLLGVTVAASTLAYDVIVTVPSAWILGFSATASLLLGAAFTVTHVVCTTALTIVGGPPLLHALERARPRLDGGTVIDGAGRTADIGRAIDARERT